MLLVVDIGNTNITFGLYAGKQLIRSFRAETQPGRTSDERAAFLFQALTLYGVKPEQVTDCILASVVPPLTDVLMLAINQVCTSLSRPPIVVGPGVKTGIAVRYDNPHDVGADRIVNAVAALELTKAGVIVVDFGTATTFDCVSPKAEYLGGVIAPGIEVSLEALLGRAAKLRPIELAVPPQVVGRTTAQSMQSGVVFGYAALVDGLVTRLKGELGFPCSVIATGGLAVLITGHTEQVERVVPELTLEGLRLIHERNLERQSG